MLSDEKILERLTASDASAIVITPLISAKQLGSASVDLRLGFHFKVLRNMQIPVLDPVDRGSPGELAKEIERYTHDVKLGFCQPFYMHPGQFALGTTLEYIRLPRDVAATLDGRSSLGRLGITVHSTAGFIDPGFRGRITYEMQNEGSSPIALYPGMRVAQLCFFQLDSAAVVPYEAGDAKYSQQLTTTSSRWYTDKDIALFRKYKAQLSAKKIEPQKSHGANGKSQETP